mmetsp:Transcript_18041/g.69811  ORF Transcript_18041/g.69811 Transcript_18041/m.69811 type:complete len:264 (-) Transcript_18041:94-885(-)
MCGECLGCPSLPLSPEREVTVRAVDGSADGLHEAVLAGRAQHDRVGEQAEDLLLAMYEAHQGGNPRSSPPTSAGIDVRRLCLNAVCGAEHSPALAAAAVLLCPLFTAGHSTGHANRPGLPPSPWRHHTAALPLCASLRFPVSSSLPRLLTSPLLSAAAPGLQLLLQECLEPEHPRHHLLLQQRRARLLLLKYAVVLHEAPLGLLVDVVHPRTLQNLLLCAILGQTARGIDGFCHVALFLLRRFLVCFALFLLLLSRCLQLSNE